MAKRATINAGGRFKISVDRVRMIRALQALGDDAIHKAKQELERGGRTGRLRSDGERASVPGEPPHTETGALEASLDRRTEVDGVVIHSGLPYAVVHEQGDRAFVVPAVLDSLEEGGSHFRGVFKIEAA